MKRPSRASSSRPVSGHYRVLIVPLQFPGSKRPDSSALHRAQHDLMSILQAASLLSHADISKPVECSPRKAKHEGGRLHRRLLQPQAIWLFDSYTWSTGDFIEAVNLFLEGRDDVNAALSFGLD